MILEVCRVSTPTVCHFRLSIARLFERYIFRPMALLESPYDIRGGATLNADNVPLDYLPIALLYKKSMDV